MAHWTDVIPVPCSKNFFLIWDHFSSSFVMEDVFKTDNSSLLQMMQAPLAAAEAREE